MFKIDNFLEKQSSYSNPDKYSTIRMCTHFTFVCATATLLITIFRPFISYIPIALIILGLITSGILYILWFIFKEGLLIEQSSTILLCISKIILVPMLTVSGGINSQFMPIVLLTPFIFMLIGGFNYAIISIVFWTIAWLVFFFIGQTPYNLTNNIWDEGKAASSTLWLTVANILTLMIILKIENINRRQQNTLLRLANSDALTDIFNRRGLMEVLEHELRHSQDSQQELSILFIDIDYFKKFNDFNGHDEGDIALKRIAACLKEQIRSEQDTIARFGGEEFIVILKETPENKAFEIAENMRKMITDLALFYGAKTSNKLSITIGLYCTNCINENQKIILKKADQALYYGKENGRNQTVSANELLNVKT